MTGEQQRAEVLTRRFTELAGGAPDGVWAAPGRVNVIGEHTDYSDGFVLPMAIPRSCLAAVRRRTDGVLRVGSLQQDGGWQSYPVGSTPGEVGGWVAYVVGVAWAVQQSGEQAVGGAGDGDGDGATIGWGADLLIDSDVPLGAGLSSSAALGCATALALRDLLGLPLAPIDLAAVARRSENEFVGAPTGAMDQAISMLGLRDHLLFLDTRGMRHEQVPFRLAEQGLSLLVIDSRTRHALVDGGYGSRRAAVEAGTRALGVRALRDVASSGLAERCAGLEPEVAARVRHVVTENERVLAVVDLLRDGGDARRIGPLLSAGHASLRDDFAVSTPELDAAVEAALAAGAHGARMTGGGFGGSAIALVDTVDIDRVTAHVTETYARNAYPEPHILPTHPSDGAHRVS